MIHPNSSKQFLKIPKNWGDISWEHRNLYVSYLWLKHYSRFGRVHKSKIPQRQFWHWLTKLKSAGLIRVEGDYWVLLGYERVWELLQIKKVVRRGQLQYRWYKLPEYYTTWGEFKKNIIRNIQELQVERKKLQFKRRHLVAGSPPTSGGVITPLFSAKATAKLLGYKSPISGSKYRERFFDVVPEPVKLRLKYTSDNLPYFKFDCKKIMIKF